MSFADYARELPATFPAVSVASTTWLVYARAFIMWFEYGGLVSTAGQVATLSDEGDKSPSAKIFGVRPPIRTRGVFPQRPPGPSLALLRRIAAGDQVGRELNGPDTDALREMLLLGAVEFTGDGAVQLLRPHLMQNDQVDELCLRTLLDGKKGCKEALTLLEENAAATPAMVGEVLRRAHSAEWALGTIHSTGKHLRAWARLAGVATRTRSHQAVDTSTSGLQLDFD